MTADRKPYAGNPVVLLDLTYKDLERSYQGHAIQNGPVPSTFKIYGELNIHRIEVLPGEDQQNKLTADSMVYMYRLAGSYRNH